MNERFKKGFLVEMWKAPESLICMYTSAKSVAVYTFI